MSLNRQLATIARQGVVTVETVADLRAHSFAASPELVFETLGALSAGDGGGGVWYWDAASADSDNLGTVVLPTGHTGAGRRVRQRVNAQEWTTTWFGGGEAGIAACFTAVRASGADTQAKVTIPAGTYAINNSIDCSMSVTGDPVEFLFVDARGARFETTVANGPAFITHGKEYNRVPYTRRRFYWQGGSFANALGVGNGAIGFDAWFMRVAKWSDCHFTGYDEAFNIGQLDSYHFSDIHFWANDIAWHFPLPSTVMGMAPLSADVLLNVMIERCHISGCDTCTTAIKCRARYANFNITNSSINGDFSAPAIDMEFDEDDGVSFTGGTAILNNHFEQQTKTVIRLADTSANTQRPNGHMAVEINGNLFRGPAADPGTIIIDASSLCSGQIDNNAFYAPTTENQRAIKLGARAEAVVIGRGNLFSDYDPGEAVDIADVASRRNVSLNAGSIAVPAIVPTGWAGRVTTEASITIAVWDAVKDRFGGFALKPTGYTVRFETITSDSSTASIAVVYKLQGPNTTSDNFLIRPAGEPDSKRLHNVGYVNCDANGDVEFTATHSPAGQVTVDIRVLAVHFD